MLFLRLNIIFQINVVWTNVIKLCLMKFSSSQWNIEMCDICKILKSSNVVNNMIKNDTYLELFNMISLKLSLDHNDRFKKNHLSLCDLLRHFSLLWENDLILNTSEFENVWSRLIMSTEHQKWRQILNEWRKFTFSDDIKAIINNAWSQSKWQKLWREDLESWNKHIKMFDEIADADRDSLIIQINVEINEKSLNSNEYDFDEKNSWRKSWKINE